jgi:N-acetylmuramic acid 6-phosphate etherase
MHDRPVTERDHPASERLDLLPTLELVRVMNRADAAVAPAVERELEAVARAIDRIAERMQRGGRLVYVGAGTSGRLGVLDAAECPPTFGVAPGDVVGLIAGGDAALVRAVEGAEDRGELARQDLDRIALAAGDALVAISASGGTPYALAAVARARELGALTVAVSCNPDGELARAAELAITPVPGPEVVSGSTRLKAGTATKLVLNMLSTGAMVRLGHVRGNRMVELRPTNAKLRERAIRIVAELATVDAARAAELLAAHGSVRAALAAAAAGPTAAPAAARTNGCIAGVDGGGTRTRAVLAKTREPPDETAAASEAGPCNLTSDLSLALRSIEAALGRARADAELAAAPFDAVCIAAAGSGDAALREAARRHLLERGVARRVVFVPDAAAVLAAANDDAWGLALIAGTGSLAYGRTRAGRCARAGGYGPAIGDPGSAHALGQSALRAAALVADGHVGSARLKDDVMRALGASSGRDLARIARALAADQVAALAPLVVTAAADGDVPAQRMVRSAATQLAELALLVLRRLFPGDAAAEATPLVFTGGLLTGIPAVAQLVQEALAATGARVAATKVKRAELGALALARRFAQVEFDEAAWFPAPWQAE